MANVTLRYWAAARTAAGTESEDFESETVAELLEQARQRHPGEDFSRVLGLCSLLLDGRRLDPETSHPLTDGSLVEALPPFAGG